MTDRFDGPRLDAETLAALMEGRLSDEERARALEVLAESDADLEVLADAAVAAAALSETSAPAEPPAPARPRRWTVWLPLAAVLAGLAIVPSLLDRGRDGGLGEWRADLARLGPVAPVDLPAPAGVDVTRSGPAGGASLIDSLTASARSFRRGATVARLTVLEPGARATSPDAATLAALLRSSAGSAVRPLVDRWLAAGSDEAATWEAAVDALASLDAEPAAFRMGLLVERTSLEVSLVADSGVPHASVVDALRETFGELGADARGRLEPEFERLMETLESGGPDPSMLSARIDAFAAAAGGIPRSPPG